jgi:histidyl-tRNA synthetase
MKFQPPKGTRDFLPEDAIKLQKIVESVKSVFEKYGFEPATTPAFESFGLLSAKGGLGEAVKDEIYYFKDKSNRELGLRFDLTMGLVRMVASNPQLPKPFKRYAIGNVWRYDNPQKLRFREFAQADIDIIGSKSLLADAECLACVCECLDKLGFKDYYIRVNNRKILQKIFEKFVKKEKITEAFRIIDKMDKIGLENVKKELEKKEIDAKILELIKISGSNDEVIKKIEKEFGDSEGLNELKELLRWSETFGIKNRLKIDLSLVRGLDYYTGVVFEVFLGIKLGCGGGGRYDNLIETVGGQKTCATGISLGLDRIFGVMKERKMLDAQKTVSKVFVANVDEKARSDSIKIAQRLRNVGISCQTDLMDRSLTKQLEFANRLGIPYVIVVGDEEIRKNRFKLKDMEKRTEEELPIEEIIKIVGSKQ